MMRIAIATDEDHVADGFGCAPFCTIVDFEEGGRITGTTLIPNPGTNHSFWADLFFRNKVQVVIAGSMGSTAKSVLMASRIEPILGVKGQIEDVVRRFAMGELRPQAFEVLQVQ